MPSCERIPRHQFHDQESWLYTERSVRDLTRSKQFQRYTRYVEYNECLQMTWFIAPIGLTIAFYYHFLFLLLDTHVAPVQGTILNAPFFPLATAVLLLFFAPCVVIAPFSGFFEPISRRQALGLVVLFTFINIGVVSFGGSFFNHPPYLVTEPPVPWFTSKVTEATQLIMIVLTRALPLEGGIIAGWLVYEWRQMRWKRAWQIPLPLITVPLFVGSFACFWFRFVTLFSSTFFASNTDSEEKGDVVRVIISVMSTIWQDVVSIVSERSLPTVFTNTESCYHLWWTTLTLSMLYFLGNFIPIFCVIFRPICWMLPTHPTTWSLMLISCFVGLVTIVRSNEGSMAYAMAFFTVLCILLHNGFVLPP
ncbi:uncharacterized protein TM35_000091930 [Trypanosoma theileri]|uniref:Uncharacterized protein n=1 Tax=Trypanosoma theileri TaxID=67003 RepID=A0A1X0P088_9TRYP|nr:uncharacterized protein TM35_000091930 [Trypanosoma theileri]ORC90143.1 hypothetical protein TM35_000091930 [Trypanosoma theileri]